LGGEIRVLAEPPNDGFVVRNTGFTFHESTKTKTPVDGRGRRKNKRAKRTK
jgi:hypothetical protein